MAALFLLCTLAVLVMALTIREIIMLSRWFRRMPPGHLGFRDPVEPQRYDKHPSDRHLA